MYRNGMEFAAESAQRYEDEKSRRNVIQMPEQKQQPLNYSMRKNADKDNQSVA